MFSLLECNLAGKRNSTDKKANDFRREKKSKSPSKFELSYKASNKSLMHAIVYIHAIYIVCSNSGLLSDSNKLFNTRKTPKKPISYVKISIQVMPWISLLKRLHVIAKLCIIHLGYALLWCALLCATKQTDYERFKVLMMNNEKSTRKALNNNDTCFRVVAHIPIFR